MGRRTTSTPSSRAARPSRPDHAPLPLPRHPRRGRRRPAGVRRRPGRHRPARRRAGARPARGRPARRRSTSTRGPGSSSAAAPSTSPTPTTASRRSSTGWRASCATSPSAWSRPTSRSSAPATASACSASSAGGVVDRTYGEPIGALPVRLTAEGSRDPLFGALPEVFRAYLGHKEAVSRLPDGAVLLASTDTCPVHAFRLGSQRLRHAVPPRARRGRDLRPDRRLQRPRLLRAARAGVAQGRRPGGDGHRAGATAGALRRAVRPSVTEPRRQAVSRLPDAVSKTCTARVDDEAHPLTLLHLTPTLEADDRLAGDGGERRVVGRGVEERVAPSSSTTVTVTAKPSSPAAAEVPGVRSDAERDVARDARAATLAHRGAPRGRRSRPGRRRPWRAAGSSPASR